ncbi:MAG: RNA-guided endonuclease TnpB family protein [Methanotrichaceae archaeon]
MKRAYKFRMYPNRQQQAVLDVTLETCRHIWNIALEDRRETWKQEGISRSYEDQANLLTVEKKQNPELLSPHSQVLQDVLRREKKAFDNFFRRVKEGARKKGYPRFKGKGRYNSITYPQSGFKLQGSKLTLAKIPGSIRVFVHRQIGGKVKTCSIKKDGTGCWFVIFTTEQENPVKLEPVTAVGVDLGLTHAAVTSDGQYFDYPKYYIQAEKRNRAAEKSLHRKKLGSQNRRKAKVELARIGKRVTNLREEFLHQVSRKLADSADLIVFENLNIQGMLKNHHLAKHIQDVSWGKLIRFTLSKAERAGKSVVLADPRNTSQRCSGCGQIVPKTLKDRVHECPRCGLTVCRDRNAALNVLTLGLRGIAYEESTSGSGLSLSSVESMK